MATDARKPSRPVRPVRPALGERYDRRQADVVTGAAAVFAEQGYERTSVAELAERLGLATGAIYHYFPGKEQLLIRICDELTGPLLADAERLLDRDRRGEAALRELVRLWVAHVVEHRDHLLVFQQIRHLVDQGEQWRGVRADRKAFERLLGSALGRALANREPAGRDLALYALLGMVNHTVQWFRPRGALSPERIADGYVDLVLGGIGPLDGRGRAS